MDGFGSGRQSGRATVESGLTLDLNRLIRQRNILPGTCASGSLTWSYVDSGETVASISYEASLVSPRSAWARLYYSANGKLEDYQVQIEASPGHYGGMRWWWICPISGGRTATLYLPPGATVFAARQAHRLAYRSQREATIDRTHARQARFHRMLGGTCDHYEQPPPRRPKGMHRKTYEQLTADLNAAMEAHERAFDAGASAIMAREHKSDAQWRETWGISARKTRGKNE
jgi:hypothetical protein